MSEPKKSNLIENGATVPKASASTNRSTRLPSFKGQRDLTLGGTSRALGLGGPEKKKFVPNLNAVLRRNEKSTPTATPTPHIPHHTTKVNSEVKPKNKRHQRPELIQTMGSIFSEGFNSDGIRRKGRYGGGGGGSGGGGSSGSTANELRQTIDKDSEMERLKKLLRDDFIDDGLIIDKLLPIQLPMIDAGKLFKEEEESKEEEVPDSKDIKAKSVIKDQSVRPELTFPDLVKTQKGDLLFIQLPDNLPISDNATKELLDLPEGYLGRIQIRKSGKTQLIVGESHFEVEMGTQIGFLQDLMAVEVYDTKIAGEMTVMGHIKHRLVVTPNWEHLLKQSKK